MRRSAFLNVSFSAWFYSPFVSCFVISVNAEILSIRKMDELQDVQLTEIKPLLTSKVSGESQRDGNELLMSPAQLRQNSSVVCWVKRSAPKPNSTLTNSTLYSSGHQSELFIHARNVGGKRIEPANRGGTKNVRDERKSLRKSFLKKIIFKKVD